MNALAHTPTRITQADCRALDAQDPLAPLRAHFHLPEGVIYLDGNSLGAQPKAALARAQQVVGQEWGQELIRAWNSASWIDLPQRLGAQLAPLIGAGADGVVVTDTTSINLYKVLHAALHIARSERPQAKTIVSERSNFPTDLYIAQSLCQQLGFELALIEPEELPAWLQPERAAGVAVLMLTHVNYRTGAMHDMAAITAAAQAKGLLTIWDLCHSAGAVPVDLSGSGADFAVGCSYKYLNGGPGAPAFVWVNPRHADRFWQPLSGWFGHAAPFQFDPQYRPASGIARYLCGTQPIVSLSLLQCGLDVFDQAQALGGMAALRKKSLALTDLFIALVEQECAGHQLGLATPREHARRGSQVSLTRPWGAGADGQDSGAYAIMQALIARGVIGDFRAGGGPGSPHLDILRFGFTPLYVGFEDVWQAVAQLRDVLDSGQWREPRFNQRQAVT
ncbi:kynureninase [Vandammella animalimorsus]|uniref:Kynureninase n=1 Tax=Vandammella animalimorsus TaxID=2029117 RepID=A0A2A2T832_9BURK|nr:kynureninase [Vandammella animalimorsus]PAT30992.1 kynureninase [Vandammella animalimorsus]PAX18282.1 kynureninase [Vandammella animalimorsus]PAX20445.1 kynureninase [Vandammella animalimorsus]